MVGDHAEVKLSYAIVIQNSFVWQREGLYFVANLAATHDVSGSHAGLRGFHCISTTAPQARVVLQWIRKLNTLKRAFASVVERDSFFWRFFLIGMISWKQSIPYQE